MEDKKCPDCSGELTKITLFGRGWENPITGLADDAEVGYYTDVDAERSTFKGMFKAKGSVESFLCNHCGRIFLYGTQK
ncbi:MAG: hypothetical protein P4L50_28305 [Anaerolineaceae bacterium]|nr:hypothetical protein [Anaerolineaceae bacterium]